MGERTDDAEQPDEHGEDLAMGRRTSAAQARNHRIINEEMEQDLKDGRHLRLIQHAFLEPWELVDPTIEHVITVALDDTSPRVQCTCGASHSAETPERAKLAARTHREHVIRAMRDYRLDEPPTIAIIERRQTPDGTRFRWICDACTEHGEWLACEPVVSLGSMLHHDACATWELLRSPRREGGQRA